MINKESALYARASDTCLPDQGIVKADAASFISAHNERYIHVLTLAAICHRILIRTTCEKHLLHELCKAFVDSGIYQLAWFSSTIPSSKKYSRKLSGLTVEASYPTEIENTWLEIHKVNLTRTALRTHKPAVNPDVFAGTGFLQAMHQILPSPIAAISLPLITDKQTLGTLNLYADEKNAFAEQEVKVLVQLAEDIAHYLQTSRKKALQNANRVNHLHTLIEYSSDILAIVDTVFRPVYISSSINQLLGYKPEQMTGKSLLAIIHPQDKESIETLLQTVVATGVEDSAEARFLHAAGNWLYFNCTVYNLLEETGINSLAVKLQNITSLKEAEAKLMHQAYEQQITFDAVPAMIYFKDTFNKIRRVNKMAADFYGLSKEEMEGKSMYELNPLFAASYHKEDIEIITSGIAKIGTTEKVILDNGETKWLQMDKVPYYNKKENSAGIIIFAQEITTQRKTADELSSTLEELKKKNYELDKYFYKISQDIRAPLSSILDLINLIKTEQDLQATSIYLGLVERSIKKLDHFIQTMVNHSRVINASTHISSIDFRSIAESCLEELRYIFNKDQFTSSIEIHVSSHFYSDPACIAIIFKHLIANSAKFINTYIEQHRLLITITVSQSMAYILIEDNGTGIEKKHLNKVFDMFFKETDKSAGTDLGLYVVKQTVEKLGGTITVSSEIGKGTSFKITLPSLYGNRE